MPATLAEPSSGCEQRREDPHRRRLPGAVRPEQAEHDPALHAQVDPVERDDLAVALAQPGRLDRELVVASHRLRLSVRAVAMPHQRRSQSGYSSFRQTRTSAGCGFGVRSSRKLKYGATNGSGAITVYVW